MDKKLLFFSNSFGHRKVLDRIEGAVSAGFTVDLICYDKSDIGDTRKQLQKICHSINFAGSPVDGGQLFRVFNWARVFWKYRDIIRKDGVPCAILVNSAEFFLFVSFFCWIKCRLYLDVADIHPIQYGGSLKSKIFRFLERISLRRGWLIVVTSPWFYWEYYRGVLHSNNSAVLIENKLSSLESTALNENFSKVPPNLDVVTIAWTGILRCNTSLKLLIELCKQNPATYKVQLVGIWRGLDSSLLSEAKSLIDFDFLGPYKSEQLGNLIANANFIWCCDFDDGFNSLNLLPNRLYQAIAAGKPCIAYAKSAVGKVVRMRGIGVVFNEPFPHEVDSCIKKVDQSGYDEMRSNELRISPSVVRNSDFADFFSDGGDTRNRLAKSENLEWF